MIDGNQALLNYHIRGNNLNANQVLCNLLIATGIFLILYDGHNYGKGKNFAFPSVFDSQ